MSSRSSPCPLVFSDDGKDCYGFHSNSPLNVDYDFQLTPELTRLDMASSALEWLDNLDSSYQMTEVPDGNIAQGNQCSMMTSYMNSGVDCQVGAAVTFFNPVQPKNVIVPSQAEVVTFGSNFAPHSAPKEKSLDSVDCVTPIHSKESGSGQEWKQRRYAVPDECKDERYWRNRSRNNVSARKSRQAKRDKDRLIARKIDELEKENAMLKMMLANFMVKQQQQQQQERTFLWQ